jgi:hypothetical protein
MISLVQRIIGNTHGWTRPSPGRLGPLGEGAFVEELEADWGDDDEPPLDAISPVLS